MSSNWYEDKDPSRWDPAHTDLKWLIYIIGATILLAWNLR